MRKLLLLCLLALTTLGARAEADFLPVDQAFGFHVEQQGNQLLLSWRIADGYYLYQDQFKTELQDAELAPPSFSPEAEHHQDPYFGDTAVFRHQVQLRYAILSAAQDGVVKISYRGCADAGLCYPPVTRILYLDAVKAAPKPPPAAESQSTSLAKRLAVGQHRALTLLLFVGLGVLLAFTPCVFPMYPIVSAIVLGGGAKSRGRTFALSLAYVQGMALTYSLMGLAVASLGVGFQAALQQPWLLIAIAILFVALALAMFGFWELRLPERWQLRLNDASNRQQGGRLVGVFLMGALSGLVASPCTTAPLAGILLFIAQSGNLGFGWLALYLLSLGMGLPLILFAMTGSQLLPKAGAWMRAVKVLFGFMLLAVALIFIERLVSNLWTALTWSLLGLAAFSYLSVMNQDSAASAAKGVRTAIIFAGLFASLQYGYLHWQRQAGTAPTASQAAAPLAFTRVASLDALNRQLADAKARGQPVMLDLYADWCVACKEFEHNSFPAPEVKAALAQSLLLQVDLSRNDANSQAFTQALAVLGLPSILFFDGQGQELRAARVTGFMAAGPFAAHIRQTLGVAPN